MMDDLYDQRDKALRQREAENWPNSSVRIKNVRAEALVPQRLVRLIIERDGAAQINIHLTVDRAHVLGAELQNKALEVVEREDIT